MRTYLVIHPSLRCQNSKPHLTVQSVLHTCRDTHTTHYFQFMAGVPSLPFDLSVARVGVVLLILFSFQFDIELHACVRVT